MKEKLLNYLLLGTDVYNRPLRKRSVLLLLCIGGGFVITLRYFVENGFEFINNIYTIIMTVVLVFFCGLFAMVAFSWPTTDLVAKIGKGTGSVNTTVKRMKLAKGFLFALIYTGVVTVLFEMLLKSLLDYKVFVIVSALLIIVTSLWAGAMITRCILTVFEETKAKKVIVFIFSSILYYLIVAQIMGFIIKSAYSIIF